MNEVQGIFCPSRYYKPTEISKALSLLSEHGSEALPIAGGTDLMTEKDPMIKVLVDISALNLSYIKANSEGVVIGAATVFSEIEGSPHLAKIPYNTLAYAAGLVGTPQIRNMGTIGGNICRPSPCADSAPVLLVLDAIIHVAGPEGHRQIKISDFFKGVAQDALEHGELATEIHLPAFPARTGAAFIKKGRVAVGDLSIASAAACVIMDDQDRCKEVRIALGSVAPTPIRVKNAERLLQNKRPVHSILQEVAAAAAEQVQPITDVRASAEYRRTLSQTLVARALQEAVEQARR